jgi:hypothetical protein
MEMPAFFSTANQPLQETSRQPSFLHVFLISCLLSVPGLIGAGFMTYQLWSEQQQITRLQSALKQVLTPENQPLATNQTSQIGQTSQTGQAAPTPLPLPSPSPGTTYSPAETAMMMADLGQSVNVLTQKVTSLEQKVGMKTDSAATTKPMATSNTVREATIFLGSGGTDNRDWTIIPSAVATIDSGSYSKIKAVYFEAGLSIVGGEAHARLYNQTTNSPLYETEVFNNTSSSVWNSAKLVFLPAGSNQFTVQLRSTSGEHASLDGARVSIFVE